MSATVDDVRGAITRLRSLRGRGTTLVSLYVPPRGTLAAVQRVRSEMASAENIRSKGTRSDVLSSLQGALTALLARGFDDANGVAIFAAPDEHGGVDIIETPSPAPSLYRCDSRFVLDPLEAMMQSTDVYGLVVIDRREASWGLLRGKAIVALGSIESHVPPKHDAGGQSQHRWERQTEHLANEFMVKVGERVSEAFRALEEAGTLKGILIGGPSMTRNVFYGGPFVDYRLRKLFVTPTFTTGYTDEFQGLKELVAMATTAVYDLEIAKETALLARFFDGIRTGRAVYGRQAVDDAITSGRAETVLISPSIRTGHSILPSDAVVISDETEEGHRFALMGGVGALLRW